jgi:hypothetical protein
VKPRIRVLGGVLPLPAFQEVEGDVLPGAHQAEVLRGVISSVSVYVVDDLGLYQWAAEETLHDDVVEVSEYCSVRNSFFLASHRDVLRDEHVDVSIGINTSSSDWFHSTLPVEGAQRLGGSPVGFLASLLPAPVIVSAASDFRVSVRLSALLYGGAEGGGESAAAAQFCVARRGAGDAVALGRGD